jgi:hypothetical protein
MDTDIEDDISPVKRIDDDLISSPTVNSASEKRLEKVNNFFVVDGDNLQADRDHSETNTDGASDVDVADTLQSTENLSGDETSRFFLESDDDLFTTTTDTIPSAEATATRGADKLENDSIPTRLPEFNDQTSKLSASDKVKDRPFSTLRSIFTKNDLNERNLEHSSSEGNVSVKSSLYEHESGSWRRNIWDKFSRSSKRNFNDIGMISRRNNTTLDGEAIDSDIDTKQLESPLGELSKSRGDDSPYGLN